MSRCEKHSGLRSPTQFAASVALHGLSLAVPREVVGSAALVASGRAGAATKSAPEASIASARGTTAHPSARVRAVAGQMTGQATAIASTAGSSAAEAQGGTVSLDVAEALAMIALLRYRSVSDAFGRYVAGS